MMTNEQISTLEQMLESGDVEAIRLGLDILSNQYVSDTSNYEQNLKVMGAIARVIHYDVAKRPSTILRDTAMTLLFDIGKKCLIDPVEALWALKTDKMEYLPPEFDI